ncbi:MAG: sulfotransferase [Acidimicrobiia bacterium]|nr:sulfotransferase [Acidimicrobiia bacterium]
MTNAFIVGSDRSGTTLLRLIVNQHSRLSVPAETWFLIDLVDEFGFDGALDVAAVESAIEIVKSKGRWKNFSVSDAQFAEIAGNAPMGLAEFFDRLMTYEIESTGKTVWVDKSPEYVLHLDWLAPLFPEARFIHISRDGRDVFESLQPRRWRGRTPWRIGQYWAACIDSADRARSALPADRWMWIKYEDLVLDLDETVRAVCSFLGVEFESAMLDFHESAAGNVPEQSLVKGFHKKLLRPPAATDVYRWKGAKRRAQMTMFEAVVDSQLARAGYERRVRFVPLWSGVARIHHVLSSAVASLQKRWASQRSESGR